MEPVPVLWVTLLPAMGNALFPLYLPFGDLCPQWLQTEAHLPAVCAPSPQRFLPRERSESQHGRHRCPSRWFLLPLIYWFSPVWPRKPRSLWAHTLGLLCAPRRPGLASPSSPFGSARPETPRPREAGEWIQGAQRKALVGGKPGELGKPGSWGPTAGLWVRPPWAATG